MADADGPAWTDRKIAEACRTRTVESVRQNLVEGGACAGTKAARDATEILDGEAGVIAQGLPPEGTSRCCAGKVVELAISTVRRTQKNGFSEET